MGTKAIYGHNDRPDTVVEALALNGRTFHDISMREYTQSACVGSLSFNMMSLELQHISNISYFSHLFIE